MTLPRVVRDLLIFAPSWNQYQTWRIMMENFYNWHIIYNTHDTIRPYTSTVYLWPQVLKTSCHPLHLMPCQDHTPNSQAYISARRPVPKAYRRSLLPTTHQPAVSTLAMKHLPGEAVSVLTFGSSVSLSYYCRFHPACSSKHTPGLTSTIKSSWTITLCNLSFTGLQIRHQQKFSVKVLQAR